MERLQTILSDLEKSVQCAICLDVLKTPVTTRCDHNFCDECIRKALKGKTEIPCPLCKKVIRQRSLRKAVHLHSIISAVQNVANKVQDEAGLPVTSSQICERKTDDREVDDIVANRDEISAGEQNGTGTPHRTSPDDVPLATERVPSPVLSPTQYMGLSNPQDSRGSGISAKSSQFHVEIPAEVTADAGDDAPDSEKKTSSSNISPPNDDNKPDDEVKTVPLIQENEAVPNMQKQDTSSSFQASELASCATDESSLPQNTPNVTVTVDVHPAPTDTSISSAGVDGDTDTGTSEASVCHQDEILNPNAQVVRAVALSASVESISEEDITEENQNKSPTTVLDGNGASRQLSEVIEEDPFIFPVSQPNAGVVKPKKKVVKRQKLPKNTLRKGFKFSAATKANRKRKISVKNAPSPVKSKRRRNMKKASPKSEESERKDAEKMMEEVEEHPLVIESVPVPVKTRLRKPQTIPMQSYTSEDKELKKSPASKKKKSPNGVSDTAEKLKQESPHLTRRLLSISSSSSDSFKGGHSPIKPVLPADPSNQQSVTDKVTRWLQNSDSGAPSTPSPSASRSVKNESFSEDDLISHSQASVEPLLDRVILLKRRKFMSPVKLDPEIQQSVRNQLWSRDTAVFGSGKSKIYRSKTKKNLGLGLLRSSEMSSPSEEDGGIKSAPENFGKVIAEVKDDHQKGLKKKAKDSKKELDENMFDVPGLSQGVSPFSTPERITPPPDLNPPGISARSKTSEADAGNAEDVGESLKDAVNEVEEVSKKAETEDRMTIINDQSTMDTQEGENRGTKQMDLDATEEATEQMCPTDVEPRVKAQELVLSEKDFQAKDKTQVNEANEIPEQVEPHPTKNAPADDILPKHRDASENKNTVLNSNAQPVPSAEKMSSSPKFPLLARRPLRNTPERAQRRAALPILGDSPTVKDNTNDTPPVSGQEEATPDVQLGLLDFSEPTQSHHLNAEESEKKEQVNENTPAKVIHTVPPKAVVETCRLVLQDFAEAANPPLEGVASFHLTNGNVGRNVDLQSKSKTNAEEHTSPMKVVNDIVIAASSRNQTESSPMSEDGGSIVPPSTETDGETPLAPLCNLSSWHSASEQVTELGSGAVDDSTSDSNCLSPSLHVAPLPKPDEAPSPTTEPSEKENLETEESGLIKSSIPDEDEEEMKNEGKKSTGKRTSRHRTKSADRAKSRTSGSRKTTPENTSLQCLTNGWGGTKIRIFKSASSDISESSSSISKASTKTSQSKQKKKTQSHSEEDSLSRAVVQCSDMDAAHSQNEKNKTEDVAEPNLDNNQGLENNMDNGDSCIIPSSAPIREAEPQPKQDEDVSESSRRKRVSKRSSPELSSPSSSFPKQKRKKRMLDDSSSSDRSSSTTVATVDDIIDEVVKGHQKTDKQTEATLVLDEENISINRQKEEEKNTDSVSEVPHEEQVSENTEQTSSLRTVKKSDDDQILVKHEAAFSSSSGQGNGKNKKRKSKRVNQGSNIVLQHIEEAMEKANEHPDNIGWNNWSISQQAQRPDPATKTSSQLKTKLQTAKMSRTDRRKMYQEKMKGKREERKTGIPKSLPSSGDVEKNKNLRKGKKSSSADDAKDLDGCFLGDSMPAIHSTWPLSVNEEVSQETFSAKALPQHITSVSVRLQRLEHSPYKDMVTDKDSVPSSFDSQENKRMQRGRKSKKSLSSTWNGMEKSEASSEKYTRNERQPVVPEDDDMLQGSPLLFGTQKEIENQMNTDRPKNGSLCNGAGRRLNIDLRHLDKPDDSPALDDNEDFISDQMEFIQDEQDDVICCSWNEEADLKNDKKDTSCHEDMSSIDGELHADKLSHIANEEITKCDAHTKLENDAFLPASSFAKDSEEFLGLMNKIFEMQTTYFRAYLDISSKFDKFKELGLELRDLIKDKLEEISAMEKQNHPDSAEASVRDSQESASQVRKSLRRRSKPNVFSSSQASGKKVTGHDSSQEKINRHEGDVSSSSVANGRKKVHPSSMSTRSQKKDKAVVDEVVHSSSQKPIRSSDVNKEMNARVMNGTVPKSSAAKDSSKANLDQNDHELSSGEKKSLDDMDTEMQDLMDGDNTGTDEGNLLIDDEEYLKEKSEEKKKLKQSQQFSSQVIPKTPTKADSKKSGSESDEIVAQVDSWLRRLSDLNKEEGEKQKEKMSNIWKSTGRVSPLENTKKKAHALVKDQTMTQISVLDSEDDNVNLLKEWLSTEGQNKALVDNERSPQEPLNLVLPKPVTPVRTPNQDSLTGRSKSEEVGVKASLNHPQDKHHPTRESMFSPSSSSARRKGALEIVTQPRTPRGLNPSRKSDGTPKETEISGSAASLRSPNAKSANVTPNFNSNSLTSPEPQKVKVQEKVTPDISSTDITILPVERSLPSGPKVQRWLDTTEPFHREMPDKKSSPDVATRMGLITTGLQEKEIKYVKGFAKKYNGEFYSTFIDDKVTHVIVKSHNQMSCDRTLKYLQGIAGKKWIVSLRWVIDSLTQRSRLPEQDYEMIGDNCMREFDMGDAVVAPHGPKRSRTSDPNFKHLSGFRCVCLPPYCLISRENVSEILKLCGAAVVDNLASLISTDDDMRNRQNLIIVDNENITDFQDYSGMAEQFTAKVVTLEWVYESVSRFEAQPLDDFIVTGDTQGSSATPFE